MGARSSQRLRLALLSRRLGSLRDHDFERDLVVASLHDEPGEIPTWYEPRDRRTIPEGLVFTSSALTDFMMRRCSCHSTGATSLM